MSKKILKALSGEILDIPPLWLMRQAGRYLAEYKETRKKAGSFLELCYSPELACEVTLQPIKRFEFDAAIIFSDILVIPHAMGVELDYIENEGPVLECVDNQERIEQLDDDIVTNLAAVFEALKLTKQTLPKETTLIGFAGAPWTVATYMVEGKGSKDYSKVKTMAFGREKEFSMLIDRLVTATIEYLSAQIEAGADTVQIFDSWAGVLPEKEFEKWVIEPTVKIVSGLKERHPNTPVIGFPKGAALFYEKYVKDTKIDGVGVDYTVPTRWAADKLQKHACVQGNLDPFILLTDKARIKKEAEEIKDVLGKGPFIFNLGHGINKETPIENVEALIEAVRS